MDILNIFYFVWLIGALFTIGTFIPDKDDTIGFWFFMAIILGSLLGWPVLLGMLWIRK